MLLSNKKEQTVNICNNKKASKKSLKTILVRNRSGTQKRTDYPAPLLWSSAASKSLQSCPTLCDPIDGSPPGSPIPGILQARTLEWVAISFSNAWKWKVKGKSLSRIWLLATPWTTAYQAPLFMGFSRQQYWGGVPLPSPYEALEQAINLWWYK